MAIIDKRIVKTIEELFGMSTGYVLDFSNNTLCDFVKDCIGINIYSDDGYDDYCSKANKIRQIIQNESNSKVFKLIDSLIDYYEDFLLKRDQLKEYQKKKIAEIREYIKENDCDYEISNDMNEIFKIISTRNATFELMSTDEKLCTIAGFIENQLYNNKKYKIIDYSNITFNFIDDDIITRFHNILHAFRHSSEKALLERKAFSEEQKNFLCEYGVLICKTIRYFVKDDGV